MGFELKLAANDGAGYSTSMPIHAGGTRQRMLDNAVQFALGRPCLAQTVRRIAIEARQAAAQDMAAAELAMLKAAVQRIKQGNGDADNEDAARDSAE